MITAIDFSEYELNGKYYGGSERKEGITLAGEDYMIKYQKQTAFGKRNNHISEFIGSHIFELCGFQAHKTYLGYRNGEQVVACKDFNVEGKQFVPFNDVGESTLDEAEMIEIMNSEEETEKRIYKFPTSQVKLNGKKSSYFEVINSLQFEECNEALRYVMMQLDMSKVEQLLDETPLISDMQRAFYKHMIAARYEKILVASFKKLQLRG